MEIIFTVVKNLDMHFEEDWYINKYNNETSKSNRTQTNITILHWDCFIPLLVVFLLRYFHISVFFSILREIRQHIRSCVNHHQKNIYQLRYDIMHGPIFVFERRNFPKVIDRAVFLFFRISKSGVWKGYPQINCLLWEWKNCQIAKSTILKNRYQKQQVICITEESKEEQSNTV